MQTEPSQKTVIIRASLIAALAALPFWPTLSAGFPWDGLRVFEGTSHFVLLNEHSYLRPLFDLMMGVERWLFGGWAMGYHIVSLLLHMTNAVLLYHIARRMMSGAWAAAASGALFALYPVHAEALGLVMGQAVLLGALFGFSSFLLYLAYAKNGSRAALAAGALFALVGMLAWQVVLMLPLMVAAHALAAHSQKRALLDTLSACGLAVLGYVVFFRGVGEVFPEAGIGVQHISFAFSAMGFYVFKLAAPVGLAFAMPLPQNAIVLLPVAVLSVAAVIMWFEGVRREALVLGAVILVLLPSGLAASFESFPGAWFRQTYLGAALVALFLGLVLGRLGEGRWLAAGAVPLVLLFAASAFYTSLPWRDRDALWRQPAAYNPNSAMPFLNLAALAIAEGRHDAGRDYLARTITYRGINRDEMLAAMRLYADIGGANNEMGLLNAISMQRGLPDAMMGMGVMHMGIYNGGKGGPASLKTAVEYFEAAVAEAPDDVSYHLYLGSAYIEARALASARFILNRARGLKGGEDLKAEIGRLMALAGPMNAGGFGSLPGLNDQRHISFFNIQNAGSSRP